jgi:hypothetical protein
VPEAIAINVGANTTLPGFRAPLYPDGSFEYVPIPEREPTDRPVPTYADLPVAVDLPGDLLDRRVHLDPCFREYAGCPAYTYGDEHGVKAGPIASLEAGDWLLFYATLDATREGANPPSLGGPTPGADDHPDWVPPDWGAYLVGAFRLDPAPVTGEEYAAMNAAARARYASNAHCKRATFDARVLATGDPDESRLFDRAVPLSSPTAGSDPNRLVTDLSADSGRGPWWRRPLRFDPAATDELLGIVARGPDRAFDA